MRTKTFVLLLIIAPVAWAQSLPPRQSLPDNTLCGAESAYGILTVLGQDVQLEDVLLDTKAPYAPANLSDLKRLIEKRPLWCLALHGHDHGYGETGTVGIGYWKGNKYPTGHFWAYVREPDGLRVFVPPDRLLTVRLENMLAFPADEEGVTLLVFDNVLDYLFSYAKNLTRQWSLLWYGSFYFVLAYCLIVALSKRNRRARVAALSAAVCLLAALGAVHLYPYVIPDKPVAQELTVSPSVVDLGTGTPLSKKEFTFEVRNGTDSDVSVKSVNATCSCISELKSSRELLRPGETIVISGALSYSEQGGRSVQVYVVPTDGAIKPVSATVTARTSPDLTIDRLNVLFGEVANSDLPKQRTIHLNTFYRENGVTTQVTGVKSSTPSLQAQVASQPEEYNLPEYITFKSWPIVLTLTPGAVAGPIDGYVTITTDSPIEQHKELRVKVTAEIISPNSSTSAQS